MKRVAKIPSIRVREVARIVQTIAFVFKGQRRSDVVYVRTSDQRGVAIPLHGTNDLKPSAFRGIIADLGLSVEQFIKISCRE